MRWTKEEKLKMVLEYKKNRFTPIVNGDGQNLYFMKNGTKTYIYIYVSGSYPYFGTTTSAPSTAWKWNSSSSCMTMTISDTEYTLAAYSTYIDAYKLSSAFYKVDYVA